MSKRGRRKSPGVDLRDRTWFTTGQVGRMVHLSDDTIARYVRQGILHAERTPGGHYRIGREELVRFCEEYKFEVEL